MAKNKKHYQEFENALADFRQRVADGKYAEIIRPSDGVVMVMPKVNSDEKELAEESRTHAADDLAGERAYKEVKAEAAEAEYTVKTEPFRDSTISFVKAPDSRVITVGIKTENALVLKDILNLETAQLRAEIAALKAENGRLLAGVNQAIDWLNNVAMNVPATIAGDAELYYALRLALNPEDTYEKLNGLPAAPIAQAEASEVVAKPKKAIPARMRVNWNQRGFSSGSYEVLGYSQEKQCYMLNISTDDTRPMLKAVKMADCLAVQS